MFSNSQFNKDISKWDVSKVTDMSYMFANSKFNKDISKWDVSNVKKMIRMFDNSDFEQDISKWNFSDGINFKTMLLGSKISQLSLYGV